MLDATSNTEDPIQLLQTAAHDHIPLNPNAAKQENWSLPSPVVEIPSSAERDSIDKIIEEIKLADWYRDQIVDRRIFAAKESRTGKKISASTLLQQNQDFEQESSRSLYQIL